MKKIFGVFLSFLFVGTAFAQAPLFQVGQVERVLDDTYQESVIDGEVERLQTVRVKVGQGTEVIEHQTKKEEYANHALSAGEKVVLRTNELDGSLYIADKFRLPNISIIFILFSGLVIYFTGWAGLRSIGGLLISLYILASFVAPQILAGANPFVTAFLGASAIACLSVYLAHGLNTRTTIAFISMVLVLILSLIIAPVFVEWAFLTGMGSEDAFFLQLGTESEINLKGLLLGGIIIGTLGLLDDITTTQVASIEEVKKANPKYTLKELYESGLRVGKEHILSLMNTLALAYFGAAMPMLLLFSLNVQPVWVTLNSESISEEIIRTLVGSTSLVLAVPIASFLAAWWYSNKKSA